MKDLKITTLITVPAMLISYGAYRLIKKYRKKSTSDFKKEDINNLVNGISNKEEMTKLYKKLIIKVHPDKNPTKIELSEEYTAKINNNRRNFNELKRLSLEIEKDFV